MLERELVAKKELLPSIKASFPVVICTAPIRPTWRVWSISRSFAPRRRRRRANNNWMAPEDAHQKMDALFAAAWRDERCTSCPTAWAHDSPFSRCGVEITTAPMWCSTCS